jgi:hypothetical protein
MIKVTIAPRQLVIDRPAELVVRLTNVSTGPCTNLVFRLALPVQILLLRDPGRIEVAQLEAGESATCKVQVRPKVAGSWMLSSTNFSYQDAYGRARRVNDLGLDLEVLPEVSTAPAPDPELSVESVTQELPRDEWETLEGWVVNTGSLAVHDVAVRVVGQVRCDPHRTWCTVGTLQPGQRARFGLQVLAAEGGGKVPLHIEVQFVDTAGQAGRHEHPATVRVRPSGDAATAPAGGGQGGIRVLFLAADPRDASRLRLGQEFRDLRQQLRLAEQRDRISLEERWSVRPEDVTQALLDVRPQVVHFSGHGTRQGALCFEDEAGRISPAEPLVLGRLFARFTDEVHCVVMNACFSMVQAETIAKNVDYVVGMSDALNDTAAIAFTVGFYQALAAGRSFDDAYQFGCIQIGLRGLRGELTPQLLTGR